MLSKPIVLLSIGFILSLSLCGVLAYLWIDRSVTQAYSDTGYERDKSYRLMVSLLESEWEGLSKDELLAALQSHIDRADSNAASLFTDDETGTIVIGTLVIELDEDRFKRIRPTD